MDERHRTNPGRLWKAARPLLVVLAAVAPGWGDRACAEETASRPNVVVISTDTLRADHMSAYGHARRTTPRIDAWASEAVVFLQAVAAAPVTLDSHMSVFTGLYPPVHGVRWFQQPRAVERAKRLSPSRRYRALHPEWPTLAEVLQAAGYETAAFVYDCYWLGGQFGFARGFDVYRELRGDARRTNAEVAAWLRRQHTEPFFLFVHYYDVHSDWRRLPYDAPLAYQNQEAKSYEGPFTGCAPGNSDLCGTRYLMALDGTGESVASDDLDYVRALYDGGVAYVDAEVGRLLSNLEASALHDKTLVVLFSDHGEEFREHGRFLHWQLYEETLHVPLIFSHPTLLPVAKRIDVVTSLVNVAPTILDLVGVPPPREMQGRSPVGLMRGRTDSRHRYVFGSQANGGNSIRKGNWKLIVQPDRQGELYHLGRDPGERTNLRRARPIVAQRLGRRLAAWRRANHQRKKPVGERERAKTVRPRGRDIERLRQLGYVD